MSDYDYDTTTGADEEWENSRGETTNYTEIVYSLQAEGPFQGQPAVFIRLAKCNMQCAGFGMKKGELTEEWKGIDASQYKSLKDIPLVKTGCDAFASWDKRFKHLWKQGNACEIAEEANRIVKTHIGDDLLNHKVRVVFTGGEPLLQINQRLIIRTIQHFRNRFGFCHFDFETNGTQRLMSYFYKECGHIASREEGVTMNFIISPKTSASGESFKKACVPDAIVDASYAGNNLFLKFTCSGAKSEIEEMHRFRDAYARALHEEHGEDYKVKLPIYLMPVGATLTEYQANKKVIVELCMKNGMAFSGRNLAQHMGEIK